MDSKEEIVANVASGCPIVLNDAVIRSAISIMFSPFFWNVVGRTEFKTHALTKLTGSKRTACYVFAVAVFSFGLLRDYLYYHALQTQPSCSYLEHPFVKLIGYALGGFGHILVLTSMYTLGITGTYLGDYFGILMDHRVECFPFSFCNNPMYVGSTLSFLGVALHEGKAVGLVLTAWVWTAYKIGLIFEEPFTDFIYSNRKDKTE